MDVQGPCEQHEQGLRVAARSREAAQAELGDTIQAALQQYYEKLEFLVAGAMAKQDERHRKLEVLLKACASACEQPGEQVPPCACCLDSCRTIGMSEGLETQQWAAPRVTRGETSARTAQGLTMSCAVSDLGRTNGSIHSNAASIRKTTSRNNFLQYAENIERMDKDKTLSRGATSVLKGSSDRKNLSANTLSRVVSSYAFEMFVTAMIVSNGVFVGVQVECNTAWTSCNEPALFTIETIYWFVFAMELMLRWAVSGTRQFVKGELAYWNLFDGCLVALSTLDLFFVVFRTLVPTDVDWNLSILRLMRIVRTARIVKVVRVLRVFTDLRVFLSGLVGATKPLMWAMFSLWLIIYVFSVVFTEATSEHLQRTQTYTMAFDDSSPVLQVEFGTIARSVFTLFKAICNGVAWGTLAASLSSIHEAYVVILLFYVIFVVFAMNNVMTGLFCQTAIESAERDNDVRVQELLKEREHFVSKLKAICTDEFDDEQSGVLTLNEFEKKLESARLKAWFESIDIDMEDGWALFKLIDTDQAGAIEIDRFVEGCVRLRGHAKKIDIRQIMYDQKRILTGLARLDESLASLAG